MAEANNQELQIWQRDKLYTLLSIRAMNIGKDISGLEQMINAAEALMSEEDVAWVEKKSHNCITRTKVKNE
jgi:hypothetical protein